MKNYVEDIVTTKSDIEADKKIQHLKQKKQNRMLCYGIELKNSLKKNLINVEKELNS